MKDMDMSKKIQDLLGEKGLNRDKLIGLIDLLVEQDSQDRIILSKNILEYKYSYKDLLSLIWLQNKLFLKAPISIDNNDIFGEGKIIKPNLEWRNRRIMEFRETEEEVRYRENHIFILDSSNTIPTLRKELGNLKPESKNEDYYVIKQGDDFYYNGKVLNLSTDTNYYKVFNILFSLCRTGGEVSYDDLIEGIKNEIPGAKKLLKKELTIFIQKNLTSKSDSFLQYAKIKGVENNGKPLLKVKRGYAIIFNNKKT